MRRHVRIRRHRRRELEMLAEHSRLPVGRIRVPRVHWHVGLRSRDRSLRWWRRRRPSLLFLLDRRAGSKLPGPTLTVSLGVHEQVAVAVQVVTDTRRPALRLALEPEVRILQFQ